MNHPTTYHVLIYVMFDFRRSRKFKETSVSAEELSAESYHQLEKPAAIEHLQVSHGLRTIYSQRNKQRMDIVLQNALREITPSVYLKYFAQSEFRLDSFSI